MIEKSCISPTFNPTRSNTKITAAHSKQRGAYTLHDLFVFAHMNGRSKKEDLGQCIRAVLSNPLDAKYLLDAT